MCKRFATLKKTSKQVELGFSAEWRYLLCQIINANRVSAAGV
jgi:hypothetical protein